MLCSDNTPCAVLCSIYVYTYELPSEDDQDQIYGAMNRCMRNGVQEEIKFWQPYMWHLDQALLRLPPAKERLYRGICLTFESGVYQKGSTILWPAYSSSSMMRSVAEEFARGSTKGTLFFLYSQTGRNISEYSRCCVVLHITPHEKLRCLSLQAFAWGPALIFVK